MHKDQRGLRFSFSADAEVRVEGAPASSPGRVTEFSLQGCFLEIAGSFAEQQRLHVKVFHSGEYFESPADVLYVRPSGVGLAFANTKPLFRGVLQKWILSALDRQSEEVSAR
jgi:PilZ domain